MILILRPNKKICVFRLMGLKMLGRVLGRQTNFFFLEKIWFYAF